MELKKAIGIIKNNIKSLLIFLSMGVLIGIGVYYLPSRYQAIGSFYVKRSIEETQSDFFTYEGYYAQQTAESYTNTIITIMESEDFKKEVLQKMKKDPNQTNLRKLSKNLDIQKSGPRIITMTIKSYKRQEVLDIWKNYSEVLLSKLSIIQNQGDPNISISQVTDQPLVNQTYKSLYIYTSSSILMSLAVYIVYISIKEYLK